MTNNEHIDQILFTAGIIPAEDDEHGIAFHYATVNGTLTAWLPTKTAKTYAADLEAAGMAVEIVNAPRIDRRRVYEMDHAQGF